MKDIKEILKFLRELPKMIGMLNMPTEKVDIVQSIREIVYEWKGYKDLENQGKLLKLPCTVGDTVYAFNMAKIIELKVIEISWFSIDRKSVVNVKCLNTDLDCFRNFIKEEFGKNVFLTREEAEAALKGLLTSKQL